MEPRHINDIQREIYRQLAANGGYLTDAHPGSVLYSLTRSFAAAALTSDQILYETTEGFFLNTAKGKQLDYRAAEYGVFRRPATAASGFVLVRARTPGIVIDRNTVFTEPLTGIQLKCTVDERITAPEEVEVKVPVVATRPGRAGNLTAGTRLLINIARSVPNENSLLIEAYVGAARNLQGQVLGGLAGGQDEESDAKLRARAIKQLRSRQACTEEAILNLVNADSRVNWATLHSPFPGHTQIWVEINTEDKAPVLNDLTLLANNVRPVGTTIAVHAIRTEPVDFEVEFQCSENTNYNQLNDEVETLLWDYCYNLPYSKPLRRGNLIYRLQQITSATFLKLSKPESDVTPPENTALRPGNIVIKHDVY